MCMEKTVWVIELYTMYSNGEKIKDGQNDVRDAKLQVCAIECLQWLGNIIRS